MRESHKSASTDLDIRENLIHLKFIPGIFRCGPASVKAVKKGEVYLPYDTAFVFAEVNGDRIYWDVKEDGSMKATNVDKKCIGNSISTKEVLYEQREDITQDYKYREGWFVCVCLSVCLSVFCLSICPFFCLSVCLSVYLSVLLSVCLSICPFFCLSICLSVCMPIRTFRL